jgi:hypothetical protein
MLVALTLAGCSEGSPTELPPLTPDPRQFLSKEEQARAIAELSAKKVARRDEALREIERR